VSTDRTVPTDRTVRGRHRAGTRTARIARVAGRRLRPATAPSVDAPRAPATTPSDALAVPESRGTSDAPGARNARGTSDAVGASASDAPTAPEARARADAAVGVADADSTAPADPGADAEESASDDAGAAGSEGSAAPARSRRPSRRVVLVVLGVLAVLLAALTLVFAASARQAATRADAAREVLGPAKTAAARILSYDYRHVQRDADAATAQLTGEFRTQYQTAMREQIVPQAPKQRAVVQAEVLSAGVSSVNGSGTQAVVIVFANQTVTNSSLTQPRVDQVRVRLTLDKQDGRWLVAKVDVL
jgi:Mce-associated membrane protein